MLKTRKTTDYVNRQTDRHSRRAGSRHRQRGYVRRGRPGNLCERARCSLPALPSHATSPHLLRPRVAQQLTDSQKDMQAAGGQQAGSATAGVRAAGRQRCVCWGRPGNLAERASALSLALTCHLASRSPNTDSQKDMQAGSAQMRNV